MADKRTPDAAAPERQSREARLKAALKANLARRKAQARARAAGPDAQGQAAGRNGPAASDAGQDKDG